MTDGAEGARSSARAAAGVALALVVLAGGVWWPTRAALGEAGRAAPALRETPALPAAPAAPAAPVDPADPADSVDPAGPGVTAAPAAGVALQLVLPDVYALPSPPADRSLARAALLGSQQRPPPLYAGLLPLLLALGAIAARPLIALVALPGAAIAAALAEAAAVAGVAGAGGAGMSGAAVDGAGSWWAALASPRPSWAIAAVALLAGVGLAQLVGRRDRVALPIGLAVLAMGVTVALAVAALHAGASTASAAVAPLVSRLPPDQVAAWDGPLLLAANARVLRTALDAAALAAFGSLCVLLWFLKRRDGLGAAGLVLAAAVDVGWRALAA